MRRGITSLSNKAVAATAKSVSKIVYQTSSMFWLLIAKRDCKDGTKGIKWMIPHPTIA